jgi:galactose mutarotase-like enzyme
MPDAVNRFPDGGAIELARGETLSFTTRFTVAMVTRDPNLR